VTFNNHAESTKSYAYGKEHEEVLQDIKFVPAYEEVSVDYEEGSTQEVKLHDGPSILLRKLDRGHDATNKMAAIKLLEDARQNQEFVTGLLYVNEERQTLTDIARTVETPLAYLPNEKLRPSREAFAKVMAEFA
jgi:2-oxoglutarate ferredoxin oxidoreductase subunit beta